LVLFFHGERKEHLELFSGRSFGFPLHHVVQGAQKTADLMPEALRAEDWIMNIIKVLCKHYSEQMSH
jgi:hypothetical protein